MTSAYESTVLSSRSAEALDRAIQTACRALVGDQPRFRGPRRDGQRTVLDVRWSWRSYGERVFIEPGASGIRILSECRSFQAIDWGKNRDNVAIVRAYVTDALQ